MENKDFDHIDKLAQDAFENFEVEFDPMDWVNMQSKLSAEASIDQIAKKALKNYEVSFDKRDWKRLERQLDKKEHLYPYIWWIKGAEVGIMALFIFTIFNLFSTKNHLFHSNQNYDSTTTLSPSSTSNQNNATEQSSDTYKINKKEAQNNKDANQVQAMLGEDDNDNNTAAAKKGNAPSIIAMSNSSFAKNNSSNNNNSKNNSNNNNSNNNSTFATSANNNNTSNNNTSSVSTNENKDAEVPNQTGNGFSGEDGTVNHSTVATADNNHNSALLNPSDDETDKAASTNKNDLEGSETRTTFSTVEIATIDAAKEAKLETTEPVFELKRLKLKLPYHCKTYIGGTYIIGANFANSMGGTSIGHGAGLTMDSELSAKFALKSALLLSYKNFNLNENITLDKTAVDGNIYEVENSKTTHLVLIEMPLDLQYTFFKSDKWKIYATTGFAVNLIGSRSFTGTQKTSYQGLSISTDINSEDYERGLFEGGQFQNNAFLTVGGGIGLERQLGDKISLYILPMYRHAVTPIGTDFMSSFNINIGVKTAL